MKLVRYGEIGSEKTWADGGRHLARSIRPPG